MVNGRQPVFGEIVGSTKNGNEKPHIKTSLLGQTVLDVEIPKIHHYYPMVDIWQVCLMPDHIHLIVRINKPLPTGKHLGIVIGAFKGGVSRAWWKLSGIAAANASVTVAGASASASRPALFEPNYNDHILMRDGQRIFRTLKVIMSVFITLIIWLKMFVASLIPRILLCMAYAMLTVVILASRNLVTSEP